MLATNSGYRAAKKFEQISQIYDNNNHSKPIGDVVSDHSISDWELPFKEKHFRESVAALNKRIPKCNIVLCKFKTNPHIYR